MVFTEFFVLMCQYIHYNKQVVIKQNTIKSMIIAVLYTSHDRFWPFCIRCQADRVNKCKLYSRNNQAVVAF